MSAFVPFLPASVLSPNRGERRQGRIPEEISEAKRQLRADTCLWLLSLEQVKVIKTPFPYARLSCIYRSRNGRGLKDGFYRADDVTNAIYAHKSFYDGFIDAALIVDDGYAHLELGIQRIERVSAANEEGVEFLLEEIA